MAIALLLTVSQLLFAQSDRGYVAGRVVDASSGKGVAGVQLLVAGMDTVSLRSDANGEWRSPAIRGGGYHIATRIIGYLPSSATADVRAGRTTERTVRIESSPYSLDQIVVTAARREQRLADAVVTTELISRADIERTGASDLGALLTEQTGIELQGGHPAGTGVMLQGLGTERVLILLDGQPIVGRISGTFDVSRIPTSVVERIEVVKGPQSTLYGTEAMGGVINIITRSAASGTMGAGFTATAGTQAQRDGSANLSFGRGALTSSVDVGRRYIETTPGISSPDGALARRLDGAGKIRWAPDSTRSLEASVLGLDERQRYLTSGLYNFGDNTEWSGRVTISYQRGAQRFTPTLYASVFDHLSRASTETKPIAGDTGSRQLQRLFQGDLLYNAHAGIATIDAGVLLRRDEMLTDRVPDGLRSLNTLEPFAQLDLAATPSISIVPGVRVSKSEQWGTNVTPRLAGRWRATDHLTFRASAGEGFRAPDFKELYLDFHNVSAGYAVVGNPNLRPEHSDNLMAGAEWSADRGYLRAQLYHNTFRDFIENRLISAPAAAPLYDYGNIDNGWTRGIELEGGTTVRGLDGLRIEGSYSGLQTHDDSTGRELLSRPGNAGRASLIAMLPFALRSSVTAVYTGRTPMARDETTGTITGWRDAYLRTDVHVARSVGANARGVELVVGADNLFDQRPAQWAGYTGRRVYTSLSWSVTHTSSDK
jgi:outer membrane receptor for ferrienterochelin and colicins